MPTGMRRRKSLLTRRWARARWGIGLRSTRRCVDASIPYKEFDFARIDFDERHLNGATMDNTCTAFASQFAVGSTRTHTCCLFAREFDQATLAHNMGMQQSCASCSHPVGNMSKNQEVRTFVF